MVERRAPTTAQGHVGDRALPHAALGGGHLEACEDCGHWRIAYNELADIAFHNKAVVYDLLFQAASETMVTIAADPRHLATRTIAATVPTASAP